MCFSTLADSVNITVCSLELLPSHNRRSRLLVSSKQDLVYSTQRRLYSIRVRFDPNNNAIAPPFGASPDHLGQSPNSSASDDDLVQPYKRARVERIPLLVTGY